MNRQQLYVKLMQQFQSDRNYWIFGRPTAYGYLEQMLAYFGKNTSNNSQPNPMHNENAKILKNFIYYEATDSQIKIMNNYCNSGKLPISEIQYETDGNVFVSMVMNKDKYNDVDIIKKGTEEGIKNADEIPFYLNENMDNGLIDNNMLNCIHGCKFLVADFTHQNCGVYFEAGYAQAIGKTVIHTCKKIEKDNLHFDVNHYNFIFWDNAKDLSNKLSKNIKALKNIQ